MTNTTLATQAAAEAREFTIEYDAKLSDEMRVLDAWFGSWAGWVSPASRLDAIDGLAGATPWACAHPDHETLPAVTDYPDGINRCQYCYSSDAAIRRFERIDDLLGVVNFAEADLPIMAPAIEEPGPTVVPLPPPWPIEGDAAYVSAQLDEAAQQLEDRNRELDGELDADAMHAIADWSAPHREVRAEIGSYLEDPVLFDCDQADVTSDASNYARVAWPFKPAEGEAEQMAAGEPDGWPGSAFILDWKTTPPPSWTDMPPLSRRQRWWFAATDALADLWRALVKPRLSVLFVVAILLMSCALNAWVIGHRTTTIVVAPRPPMTCTPISPGSDTIRCRATDQP